jgi:tRNA threonylcarbamoyladenosine biosynthesis protein TsaB
MTGILAIETATDACSVAVFVDGQYRQRHEVIPRQHSQRLFGMLQELLPNGDLRAHGIEAIAYGCGPGSFTGLRIAASAVQGLAYASGLPAISISSLACQSQSALRVGEVHADDTVLSTIDARINEVYGAVYSFEQGLAVLQQGPWACAPAEIPPIRAESLCAVGSGCHFLDQFPSAVRAVLRSSEKQLLPEARDLIPLALEKLGRGDIQSPQQVQPVYVRDEISWKKLSQQGKKS